MDKQQRIARLTEKINWIDKTLASGRIKGQIMIDELNRQREMAADMRQWLEGAK